MGRVDDFSRRGGNVFDKIAETWGGGFQARRMEKGRSGKVECLRYVRYG